MEPTGTDPVLVADIGGTNARFALCDSGPVRPQLRQPRALRNAGFASLEHAVEHYLAETGARPRRAVIALASPIGQGEEVRLTNRAWSFNRTALREALGLDELRLLNDFGAIAHAVPALGPGDIASLHGDGRVPVEGPVSVLGPGTGLGVALLVGSAARGWQVVETEGGHASFAPLEEEERLVAEWIVSRHGRASWERLLSGNGLATIDAVLREHDGGVPAPLREPGEVVAAALQGRDAFARRALARFCAILGSVAGDVALLHGARAVVIAGGIVPRFLPFLRTSAFRERFLDKGRFATWLEPVSIQVVTHPNPGLLGAAMALRASVAEREAGDA